MTVDLIMMVMCVRTTATTTVAHVKDAVVSSEGLPRAAVDSIVLSRSNGTVLDDNRVVIANAVPVGETLQAVCCAVCLLCVVVVVGVGVCFCCIFFCRVTD